MTIMTHFKSKLVAVLNGKIDSGKIMNALAHMSLGFGGSIDKERLKLLNYKDADGNDHENISGNNAVFHPSCVRTRLHTGLAGSPDTIQKCIMQRTIQRKY